MVSFLPNLKKENSVPSTAPANDASATQTAQTAQAVQPNNAQVAPADSVATTAPSAPKEKKSLFKKMKKEEVPAPDLDEFNANHGQKPVEKAPDRPLIKYRYVIVNAMGKKENGTFEAENETEVRNFLLSQDYEVVSIKVRPGYDIDINDHAKMKVGELSFSLT